MKKTFIGVREVDEETFRKFRAKAVQEKLRLGYALTLAMEKWLEKDGNKEKNLKNLLKIKPVRLGDKEVRLSEEIDNILYSHNDNS